MTLSSRWWPRLVAGLALILGAMQLPVHAYQPRVLRMGFIPSENPQDVMRNANDVVGVMRRKLGMPVVAFAASDYTGVIESMKNRRLDLAYFSPAAYVLAERQAGARAILKVMRGGKSTFHCAIITHRDSSLHSLQDLRGKSFAFVDPASLSGALYPKLMLLNEHLNPERDFARVVYAGGHDMTVQAVLNRRVDAGATFANDTRGKSGAWKQFIKDPARQAEIRVLAYSAPLPSDCIAVAGDLDPSLVRRITLALGRVSEDPVGAARLSRLYRIDGFAPSSPADYSLVREVFDRLGPDHH